METEEKTRTVPNVKFLEGRYEDIPNRGLSQRTCEFWGYQIGELDGKPCHIANFRDEKGRLLAQKVRYKVNGEKQFKIIGDGQGLPLYGSHLWSSGKSLIITTGELDALAVSQAQDNKYPVVSVPQGDKSAVKTIKAQYDWVCGFDTIVLMFDMDEPGQKAALEVAQILPMGRVKIAKLRRKDASDVLVHDGGGDIVRAFWQAEEYRPDGIVKAKDLRDAVLHPVVVPSIPFPWDGLNEKLGGLRQKELLMLTAGSGVGKSTLVRELVYHLLVNHSQKVGVLALEESNARTIEGLITVDLSKNIVVDRALASPEAITKSFDFLTGTDTLFLYDHFGSNSIEAIIERIRYLVLVCGCQWVIIDHISILVSGLETTDERKLIDIAMTKLRTLISELGCGIIAVSHLKRPDGNRGHEDGADVSLGQLRGSHSIAQLSDSVVGLQKDPEDPTADRVLAVVLKNRWSGARGHACMLEYNRDTGRLTECVF